MFKRKRKEKEPEKKYPVETIPEIFYGGNDPQVYHRQETAPESVLMKEGAKKTSQPKKTPAQSEKVSSTIAARPRWQKITAISVVFLLAVGAISWYYLRDYFAAIVPAELPVAQEKETQETIETEESETQEETLVTTTEQITQEDEVKEPESLESAPLEFPRVIQIDTNDLDSDGLTDLEEELFNTDSGSWDTDEDGYYDGLEIINLYSPIDFSPSKLIDSGLIQEYINSSLNYRFYYPVDWEVGSVDIEGRQLLVSSITGDYIELRVFELNNGQLFTSWFAQNAKSQKFLDLEKIVNRFKEEGYKRQDDLVAYFMTDKLVYTIIYHPGTLNEIPYRHVMEMLVASFRPDKTLIEIPEQEILSTPGEIITETEIPTNEANSTSTQ